MTKQNLFATFECLCVQIEYSNMDAHAKATNKAIINSIYQMCRECLKEIEDPKENHCADCKWHKMYLKVNAKV